MSGPTDDDLDALLARLDDPRGWAFVVDFDGTLSPIVDRPDEAVPADGAVDALAALAEVSDVTVLSGRALEDLATRLGDVPPGVRLVGGHGSEARGPDGRYEALTDLDAAGAALDPLEAELRGRLDDRPGWLVERKATSLVVHHRLAGDDDVAELLPRVRAQLEAAAAQPPGFVVQEGKAIVELKVAGVDKGRALAWIVDAARARADRGTVKPVVIGDDTTDEDAFAEAVSRGGEGVRVDEDHTPSSARFRLRDPSRVVTLLCAVRAATGVTADEPRGTPTSDTDG